MENIMFFDGNYEVLSALKEKSALLLNNLPHAHIRTLVVVCGGALKGVYGGGAVTALDEYGLRESFDVVVGLSTGAPIAAYFLSGQAELGTSIYSEECCTKKFIDPFRFSQICDVRYLVSVFRSAPSKRLDTVQMFSNRSKLYIAVTESQTAKQHFFSPKDENELFQLIEASISMPGVCPKPVLYNDDYWLDGSFSDPLPIEHLIEMHQPTHVLVIANRARTYNKRTSLAEKLLYEVVLRSQLSAPVRKSASGRHELMSQKFRWIQSQSQIPILIGWGDDRVESFTRDSIVLRNAASRSRERWRTALSGH